MAVKRYEGMFVVDSSKSGAEFPETVRLVADILQRHRADIERIEKWGERKFAYPIKRSKRGIYILTYFQAEGSAIREIREDVSLNEDILRVLIILPEKISPVTGELYTPEGEELSEEETEAVAAAVAAELEEEAEEEEELVEEEEVEEVPAETGAEEGA